MKKINLTHGYQAYIDDCDLYYTNQHNWCICNSRSPNSTLVMDKFYIQRANWDKVNKKRQTKRLHIEIWERRVGPIPKGYCISFKNGNTFDCRLSNLQLITKRENSFRMQKTIAKCSSKYKGVYFRKTTQKWVARIQIDSKTIEIGRYDYEKDAAMAYNKAAIKYFGEFAWLNKITSS